LADSERPISWLALREGTPVYAGDEEVGKVSEVVADVQKDIFSGVAFRQGILRHERFAPAGVIESMTSGAVRLSLSPSEAEQLERYEG
jgi:uncharacterized protein YrrD